MKKETYQRIRIAASARHFPLHRRGVGPACRTGKGKVVLLALMLLLFLSNCVERVNKTPGRLYVLTTTGMIKDAVENIGGNRVDVIALMGPGVDPHLYKASHGDLEKLTAADVVFYNGLHLEGKMGEMLNKLSRTRPVVAITSEIPESALRTLPGYQAHDPHIWFDIKLWQQAMHAIIKALQKYDSANAEEYQHRGNQYLTKLDSLHQAIKETIAAIPVQQRVLITAHDAFGYFGDAYGIDVRGLQGISTLSEFGLRDLTELVNFIIARKVKAIFVETSVSQKSIEAVIEGCKEKGWNVKIGGNLYSDAMGDAGTPESTFVGMVNANVKAIVGALK